MRGGNSVDWSRIKTIFIIAFLILDLFLLSQLLTKHRSYQFEVKSDTSFEENLKTDGIEYKELPKDFASDHYLSANTKVFSEEEIKEVNSLKNQRLFSEDGTILQAELTKPISMMDKDDFSDLDEFVKANVLYGEKYGFWSFDKEEGTITYYQNYHDQPLFMNRSAHLVFFLNDANEIQSYEQTMLDTVEPISDKEEVYPAIRALEALYRKGVLKPNSKVIKSELGYYTLVNMEATQVLTPTWRFLVEREGQQENLLVNAFEGQIIQANQGNEKNIME
nr:two-component system regulatory protein YycI [Lederbergia citrea]